MSDIVSAVQAFATLFARLGCFMVLLPGLGSTRTPLLVRLWIAVAASFAMLPLLWPHLAENGKPAGDLMLTARIIHEVVIGFTLGFMARVSILALQFGATLVVNATGLAGIPGQAIEEVDVLAPLASLASVTAVMLIFATDLHLGFIEALISSYVSLPLNALLYPDSTLQMVLSTISDAHVMALKLAAPFMIYSITVNVAIGLANRFAPTISIYFISLGIVTIGGLTIFSLIIPDWLRVFLQFNEDLLIRIRQ